MIKVGKRYIVTRETAKTVERFTAIVTSVEDRGEFLYIGYKPDDKRRCKWGYFKAWKNGVRKAINYTLQEA